MVSQLFEMLQQRATCSVNDALWCARRAAAVHDVQGMIPGASYKLKLTSVIV